MLVGDLVVPGGVFLDCLFDDGDRFLWFVSLGRLEGGGKGGGVYANEVGVRHGGWGAAATVRGGGDDCLCLLAVCDIGVVYIAGFTVAWDTVVMKGVVKRSI